MSLINLTINGISTTVPKETTVLNAAKELNIKIPTLCHLNIDEISLEHKCGSCRVCMVDTPRGLIPACATNVVEGMIIETNSSRALEARKTVVELLLSDHPQDCLVCDKSGNCDLQKIAQDLGIRNIPYQGSHSISTIDDSSPSIQRDNSKCILCRRCESMCNNIQKVGALSGVNRGFDTTISTFFDLPIAETNCTFCGQCIAVCPTGALSEVNNISKVWDIINHKDKISAVQIAPAVRVALGEEFGLEANSLPVGKIVSALRDLGFKYVFDTNFAADITILEEASEFLDRLKSNTNLPLITSCCPAWINYIEHNYPEFLNLPSSCKSPQEMFGSVAKNYFAPKVNLKPEDLLIVSVMPCVAKKYESSREELSNNSIVDVNVVITTRELAKMIKEAGIDLPSLDEDAFDTPLGESTGAADIFGTTGGVLEAALRTSYEWVTNSELENLDFNVLRGLNGIKETSVDINGTIINACVASGLGNAKKIMDDIKSGKSNYHIVEIMACPGGCIAGGGQPYHGGDYEKIKCRSNGLYEIDKNKQTRQSHKNPDVAILYKDFFEAPNSSLAHKYLHTNYIDKSKTFLKESTTECATE